MTGQGGGGGGEWCLSAPLRRALLWLASPGPSVRAWWIEKGPCAYGCVYCKSVFVYIVSDYVWKLVTEEPCILA